MDTTGRRLGWKLFAVVMALSVGIGEVPQLFGAAPLSHFETARIAIDAIAALGLVGYAWRRPILPLPFWRGFVPLFCLWIAAITGQAMPAMLRGWALAAGDPALAGTLALVTVMVAMSVAALTIALLRQAALVGPTRRPLGRRPSEPAQLSLPFG